MADDLILNFASSQNVSIIIDDVSTIPLAATFQDMTNPASPADIDLTNYAFAFQLKANGRSVKNYTIKKAEMSNTFLAKIGTINQTLDMTAMWRDIQQLAAGIQQSQLLQVMTQPDGTTIATNTYTIVGTKY